MGNHIIMSGTIFYIYILRQRLVNVACKAQLKIRFSQMHTRKFRMQTLTVLTHTNVLHVKFYLLKSMCACLNMPSAFGIHHTRTTPPRTLISKLSITIDKRKLPQSTISSNPARPKSKSTTKEMWLLQTHIYMCIRIQIA